MKFVTIAVIFAGIISYGTTYSPQAVPAQGPSYLAFSNEDPPLASEPDDEEDEHRVRARRRTTGEITA